MHRITAGSLLVAVVFWAGCTEEQMAKMRWWEKKQTPPPATQAAEPASSPSAAEPSASLDNKPEHKGFYVTVLLDSTETTPDKIEGDRQYWKGRTIMPTPTVKYEIDKTYFGQVKSVEINFNPVKNGQIDTNDVWQCPAVDLKPGEAREFKSFSRIAGGKMDLPVSELAPGQYVMFVTVNGEKAWDRQMIKVEVK